MSKVKRYGYDNVLGVIDSVYGVDPEWVKYSDYAALQQKLDAVLAENVALKEGNELALDIIWDENTYVALLWQSSINNIGVETPATDEILNAVRAEAIDEFGKYHNFSEKLFIQQEAKKYAAQLRAGSTEGGV